MSSVVEHKEAKRALLLQNLQTIWTKRQALGLDTHVQVGKPDRWAVRTGRQPLHFCARVDKSCGKHNKPVVNGLKCWLAILIFVFSGREAPNVSG